MTHVIRSVAALALVCSAAQAQITNGSFSAGNQTPDGWENTDKVRIRRDTDVFFKGPASLCLIPGGAEGNANQKVKGLAGKTVTFSGHARRELNAANVQVFALLFDKNWKSSGWRTLFVVTAPNTWMRFESTQSFPPDTGTVLFGILAKGDGRAWLDEVAVTEGGPAKKTPSASPGDEAAGHKVHDLSKFEGPQPRLLHLGAVASDVLCLHVREYRGVRGTHAKYEPKPNDKIVQKKHNRILKRGGHEIGAIGGPEDNLWLTTHDTRTGKPLQLRYAMDPKSYGLSAGGGAGPGVKEVYRKSKPFDSTRQGHCREHFLFLKLEAPLSKGTSYTLSLGKVNLEPDRPRFTFDAKKLRSEAVHVSQVGFRADDPAKLGFLSIWMGTGGAYTGYFGGMTFHLVDVLTGNTMFSGTTRLRAKHTQAAFGLHAKKRNFELADTYVCDFSQFGIKGRYVLSVDGVGCSYPFIIGEDSWARAYKTSMSGFYHQRSGQAWEKPYAAWERPRDLHPADGAHNTVYALSMSELDFAMGLGDGNLHKLPEYKTEVTMPNAWGGYHDAGDYDRRQSHMVCSRRMMELLDLYPGYFAKRKLNLPENKNDIPDVLDEALWCPSLYKRMQRDDGAVYGGIETNGHPNHGEASHLDTLTKFAFAPDVRASWTYAATAAQASYLLERVGKLELAADWLKSSLAAMRWAESDYAKREPQLEKLGNWWQVKDMRNLAALNLYRVTLDEKWHDVFLETCGYRDADEPTTFKWKSHSQAEAAILYARLENVPIDEAVKANAKRAVVAHADFQVDYASKQAYMFTAGDIGAPLIISSHAAPKGLDICRAHYLTGDGKYLEWAIKSSQFSVGANPMNVVMTTGLGHRPAMYPLYLDMKYMGKDAPPPGITLYGIKDPGFGKPDWANKWILDHMDNCWPKWQRWPVSEFFFDTYKWPMVNEFTVQQSMAPTVYVWGYLAARGSSRSWQTDAPAKEATTPTAAPAATAKANVASPAQKTTGTKEQPNVAAPHAAPAAPAKTDDKTIYVVAGAVALVAVLILFAVMRSRSGR